MQNVPKKRTRASTKKPKKPEEIFDPAIWKDKQEILQTYHISTATLARYRKEGVRFKQYKKKCFYNIEDIDRIYKEKRGKKDWLAKWPISPLWTAVIFIEPILFFASNGTFAKLLNTAIPLVIAIPADIIIEIRKRRQRK